jgi:hypothetical protein
MAMQPTFEESDADLLQQAVQEQDVAMETFNLSQAELLRHLDAAHKRDELNGEMR